MGVIIPILSKFDDKGIRQAKGAFGGLKSNVSGLRRMLAGGLAFVGLNASVRGLVDAAKAAGADIKAQELLRANLQRTTNARSKAMAGAEAFVQKLAAETGIIDDELRPSLAALAATTHNVNKAQRYLAATLDLAAKSGFSQSKVQTAISRAYFGNMMSLKKMFPEVNRVTQAYEKQHGQAKTVKQKTDLARYAIDWLAKRYKGIAAQQATPFDRMNIAMDNLKEAVGMAVLPELEKLVNFITVTVVPKVQEFFGELTNPQTEVGAAFAQLKTDIGLLAQSFGDFFKLFSKDGKSGAAGFIKFVDGLVVNAPIIIGVLAAFKGIKWLTMPVAGNSVLGGLLKFLGIARGLASGAALTFGLNAIIPGSSQIYGRDKPKTGNLIPMSNTNDIGIKGFNPTRNFSTNPLLPTTSNVTININGVVGDKVAVGKAVTEALRAYQQKNGTAGRPVNAGRF